MWCHGQGQEDGKASREDLEARLEALTVKAKAAAEVCAAAEVRAYTAEAARDAAEAARLAAERVRRWRHAVHYRRRLFLLTDTPGSLLLPCPFMQKVQHIVHKLTNAAICPRERWPGRCLNAAALCNRNTEAQAQAAAAAAEVEHSELAGRAGAERAAAGGGRAPRPGVSRRCEGGCRQGAG